MENIKDGIEQTRAQGLGSSDAKMVAQVGRSGIVHEAAKFRLAQMLGIEDLKRFSVSATRKGNRIEDEVFAALKKTFPQSTSNPFYISDELTSIYGFGVFNHIDYEIVKDGRLIWVEHKTTVTSYNDLLSDYKDQLAWHWMLLNEKAKKLELFPDLKLSHYFANDDEFEEFDGNKLTVNYFDVKMLYPIIDEIKNGLKIIANFLPTFEYEKKEEVYLEMLPAEIQQKTVEVYEILKSIDEANKKVDEFKEQMLNLMEKANVKSIKNDYFAITRVAESATVSFDSKKFKLENPELAKKYEKTVNKKSYITIKTK